MASQEFLASFAVELDESGITRLQSVLKDNRTLADALSAAFASAASGLSSLIAEVSKSIPDLSAFVTAQNDAADAANQAREAISSLAAAYAALSAAIPSDSLSLDFSSSGDTSNESGRKTSDVSDSLSDISSMLSRIVGTLGGADTGSGGSSGSSAGTTSATALTWPVNLDLTKATAMMQSFINSASTQFRLTADASEIVDAASSALDSVRSMFNNTTLRVNVTADTSSAREALDDLENNSGGGSNGGSDSGGNSGSGSGNNSSGSGSSSGNNSGNNSGSSGSTSRRMSTGGRFTSPTEVEVAEDGGTEYIIPLEKENQALPLLRQLLSELSASARAALLGSSSSPAAGTGISFPEEMQSTQSVPSDSNQETNALPQIFPIAEEFRSAESPVSSDNAFPMNSFSDLFDLSSLRALVADLTSAPAASAPTNISYQSVQAPVNIRVTSSEASPEAIGQSVYNVAEKYLLRTLNGVFA